MATTRAAKKRTQKETREKKLDRIREFEDDAEKKGKSHQTNGKWDNT